MKAIFLFIFSLAAHETLLVDSISTTGPATGSSVPSEDFLRTSLAGEGDIAGNPSTQRTASSRPFEDLAPRQKVMGLVNAVALLRTKISLIEEMRTAFEPRMGPAPTGPQSGHALPGPALAYGDCRLGILGFDVCRHLGFLESDPMVAPSSTQNKMLKLSGSSSLINSLKVGQLNLHGDPDLNLILGPELVAAAVRAIGACWNAHLLIPAFDARPVKPELTREAMSHADAFLFLTAMHAKDILRFSRSDLGDVGSWLASIFSDLPGADSPPMHSSVPPSRENKSRQIAEGMPEKATPSQEGKTDESPSTKDQTHKTAEAVSETAPAQKSDSGLFGNFFSRFFSSQPQQPSQAQDGELIAAPTNVLSALTSSVGDITSMVTTTAQNAVKAVSGDAPPSAETEEAVVLEKTEKRLEDILNMIPSDVHGQF